MGFSKVEVLVRQFANLSVRIHVSCPCLHLLFSLVRLDSIRLRFYLPCVGDRIWQDDVMNI